MVHNCLLASNNLGRRVTREGNKYHFYVPSSAVTVILDQPSAPVCHSPLQARDFPLESPLIISGRITALSSRYLGFPNSPITSPPVKQPRVHVQVSSCIESFVLQGELGQLCLPRCNNSTAQVHHRITKAEPGWTKEVSVDTLH